MEKFDLALKQLYKNKEKIKEIDNFVSGTLDEIFKHYAAEYFIYSQGLKTPSNGEIERIQEQMKKEVSSFMKSVNEHYGERLKSIDLTWE